MRPKANIDLPFFSALLDRALGLYPDAADAEISDMFLEQARRTSFVWNAYQTRRLSEEIVARRGDPKERRRIAASEALALHGSQAKAAKALGKSKTTLRRWLDLDK